MKKSNLTRHAEERLTQRSTLTPEELRRLLDCGASVPVATQKGGRHAKLLLYSPPDDDWFIVVKDGDDGGVLTLMPLDYLKNRLPVTAAQKRGARGRARLALAEAQRRLPVQIPVISESTATSPTGWKIRVRCCIEGKTLFKNLDRTLPNHGDPAQWSEPGPIHTWLRDRLIQASIPFRSVERLLAEKKGHSVSADHLLENLPLTPEEVEACR